MNRTRDRLASVAFAMLLQMGFVAIFIYSLPLIAPPKRLAREITFFLPRLRELPRAGAAAGRGRAPPSLPVPEAPLVQLPPLALPPPATDLQAFGQALFGCAPENLNSLTAEQRAHCAAPGRPPRDATGMAELPSLVTDLPRRQAELAARNTPARVPCASVR